MSSAAPSLLEVRKSEFIVRARLSAPGVEIELCEYPAVRGEQTTTRDDEPILSLGLSPLLPDSFGRYRPETNSRFASFGPLHLRPAGIPLQFRFAGGEFRSIRCRFAPAYFAQWSGLGDGWTPAELDACLDIRAPRIEDVLLRLADECARPQADSATLAAALTGVALVDLGRHFRAVRARAQAHTGGLPGALLRRVVEHVERSAAPPSVAELAAICGLSRGHFIRSFQRSTGSTPAKYVEAARISRAKAMLAAQDRSISAIAHGLGFSSAAAFSRVFRRATGRSPSDYRLHMR